MDDHELTLIEKSRTGDFDSWRELVDIYAPRLAAYVGARLRRPDIVDKLVADTVYVAWKNLAELEKPADFPSWFRKMGGSVTMRWYKRHHGEGISGEFPIDRIEDSEQAEEIAAIDKALGKLPEKQRMALEQRFRAGLEGED